MRIQKSFPALIAAIALLAWAGAQSGGAATVKLKNGNTIEGRIVRVTETHVIVDRDGTKLILPKERVAPADESTLAQARAHFDKGELENAKVFCHSFLCWHPDHEAAKALMKKINGGIIEGLDETEARKRAAEERARAQARKALEEEPPPDKRTQLASLYNSARKKSEAEVLAREEARNAAEARIFDELGEDIPWQDEFEAFTGSWQGVLKLTGLPSQPNNKHAWGVEIVIRQDGDLLRPLMRVDNKYPLSPTIIPWGQVKVEDKRLNLSFTLCKSPSDTVVNQYFGSLSAEPEPVARKAFVTTGRAGPTFIDASGRPVGDAAKPRAVNPAPGPDLDKLTRLTFSGFVEKAEKELRGQFTVEKSLPPGASRGISAFFQSGKSVESAEAEAPSPWAVDPSLPQAPPEPVADAPKGARFAKAMDRTGYEQAIKMLSPDVRHIFKIWGQCRTQVLPSNTLAVNYDQPHYRYRGTPYYSTEPLRVFLPAEGPIRSDLRLDLENQTVFGAEREALREEDGQYKLERLKLYPLENSTVEHLGYLNRRPYTMTFVVLRLAGQQQAIWIPFGYRGDPVEQNKKQTFGPSPLRPGQPQRPGQMSVPPGRFGAAR